MALAGHQAGLTMGVEEEFLLLDPISGTPVALAEDVAARAGSTGVYGPGELQYELAPTQVEFATGVCTDLLALERQLRDARQLLSVAARREGARLVSSGTPPLAGRYRGTTPGRRFERIGELYQGLAAGYQASGCHVHIGVPDRETAVAVVNHLRPWLPALLAVSVNSPFAHGRETGYASWRIMDTSRFPGAGIPPWFRNAASYDQEVDRLVECGVLVDPQMTFWMARPSNHLPTVEVRVADAAGTVEEAVVQAGLTRALVRTSLARLAVGEEAPRLPDQVAAAAVWSAARYGLEGPAVDPFLGRRTGARTLLRALTDHLDPALEETGDLTLVHDLLAAIMTRGTGAARQREAAKAGGVPAVIGFLVGQITKPAYASPFPAHRHRRHLVG